LIAGDAGQQRDQAHKIYPALQFRSGMLKIDRGRERGSAASKSLAALVGGAKNVTCRSGAAAAMARTNGKCQMTSPIPGLT
jgi:hypothetical protein